MGFTEILVKNGETLSFKQHSANNGLNNLPEIEIIETSTGYKLSFEDTNKGDEDFNDLVIDITSSTVPTNEGNINMASLQTKSSHAILDLSGIGNAGATVELTLTSA